MLPPSEPPSNTHSAMALDGGVEASDSGLAAATGPPSGPPLPSPDLVTKDVWEKILEDHEEDLHARTSRGGNFQPPTEPGNGSETGTAVLGTTNIEDQLGLDDHFTNFAEIMNNKRPRAGTLSSVCSEDMRYLLASGGDELGSILSSMDLDKVFRPSCSGRTPSSSISGGPAPMGRSSMPREDSNAISSREIDRLLDGALLSPHAGPSSAGSSGPSAPLEPPAAAAPRGSPDLTRPLWRRVIESVDSVRTKLAATGDDDLKAKQALLRAFYDDVMPRLKELGPVGGVSMLRLDVMMAEAGLFVDSVQPETVRQLMQSAQQALTAIKNYASSAIIASIAQSTPAPHEHAPLPEKPFFPAPPGKGALAPDAVGLPQCSTPPDGCRDVDVDSDSKNPKLHACKNCQRAKTACNDTRPCARCVRLGLSCDGDTKAVKRACASCKRSKVKCDLDDRQPCSRCTRLAIECTPHVPNKKKRVGGKDDDDDSLFSLANLDQLAELEQLAEIATPNRGVSPAHDVGVEMDALALGNLDDVVGTLLQEATSSAASVPAADPSAFLPLLSPEEAMGETGWVAAAEERGVRVGVQRRGERHFCAVSIELDGPAAKGVEALRALQRNWAYPDDVLQRMSVLSESGALPSAGVDATDFLQQTVALSGSFSGGAVEMVLQGKWSVQNGRYSLMARPVPWNLQGISNSSVSMDAWLVPSGPQPDKSLFRVVAEVPAELSAKLIASDGAKHVCGWAQRVQASMSK
ncbi:hypothetical protein AB1Y20_013543 [Prymnesium parvum]|uniref:Zn(2)-C6 fungal-type domain-containing protein n=1 Tax=Prymnesium parvum TaxID=97485 RepID=A0AB34IHR9_PRYPA